jgi:hypothetical protein
MVFNERILNVEKGSFTPIVLATMAYSMAYSTMLE